MILPAFLPDETLCSILARLCRLNGVTDFRDIAAIYLADPVCPSFIDSPIDLPKFCRRTSNVYGDPQSVLENLTWYVAQARLGEREVDSLSAIVCGNVRPTLSQLTFDDLTALGFCLKCVEEDVGRFGVAYWHRTHQLSIVHCCPHHGCPVTKVKVKRASLHFAFPLPGDFAFQDGLMSTAAGDLVTPFEIEVAATAYEILSDANAPCDDFCINLTFIDELRTRRLLMENGEIRHAELLDPLKQSAASGRGRRTSDENKMLVRLIRSLTTPGNNIALGRTLLVQCLFGSWKAFRERVRWMDVLGVQKGRQAGMSDVLPNPENLKAHYRTLCETFMREHLNCSRLDFTKAEYRNFRWLLHNDKEWLNSRLPIPERDDDQLPLF